MAIPDLGQPSEAVLGLWDRLIELAARVGPDDLVRSTPCPGADVRELLGHLAGVHGGAHLVSGSPGALADALRAARAAQAAELAARAGSDRYRRLTGACCLDLWVHGYDLATAVGQPVDLEEDSVAVAEASRFVLGYLPGLLARASSPGLGGPVRVELRGGRGLWRPGPDAGGDAGGEVVTADPGVLLLLLSGRVTPERLRDQGGLEWSGPAAEAFVRTVRLPG
jgi:uncharacterized protein (TIGR03083 family)